MTRVAPTTALLQPPAGGPRAAAMLLRLRLPIAGLAAVAAVALAGCQTAPTGPQPLPPAVLQALQKANVPAAAMAAAAVPLGPGAAGQPGWRYRADVPMQPASTMKLVTSIVALDRLGPNHRGTTQLRSAAPVEAGVLQGDLVLQGGADPDFGVPQFWALLVDLRQRGISAIHGDLLVDRTLFEPARQDAGVPPFDDAPEFPYNAIPDALQLAGNLLTFEMRSTPSGGGVLATTVPPLPGLALDGSRMAIVDDSCANWSRHWKPATVAPADATGAIRIALNGGFPRDCTQRVRLQLIDRLALTDRLFSALWQGLGGQWTGRIREAAAPPGAALLAQHTSRPWGELLRQLNKESDNALARLLYLQLGVPTLLLPPAVPPPAAVLSASPAPARLPARPTADIAADTVRAWFAQHGIDAAGLVLDNGSGLSRSERITPWQLVQLLRAAWDGPNAADLVMSLPTAGVDGTLRNRLQASPAAGWARLKTGGLRNVVALAGYVRDATGRPWAVAAVINHDDVSLARPVLDVWIDSIARGGPFTAATP